MKVSIAVPSYNYGQFIEACLNSIRQQDYENFEVLIADGGSTDDTLEVIERYCSEDSRFRLVSTEDQGQADAIRKAFSHADGDLFCFLNADDCYVSTSVFSDAVENFRRHPDVSLLSFGGYYIDETGKWIKAVNLRYHPLDGFHLMRYRTAVLQPATFWLRKVHEAIEWPAQFHFVFDVVFFYRAFEQFSWLELPEPVAGYRLHGSNKSLTIRPERVDELVRFEAIKFSENSYRTRYLHAVSVLIHQCEKLGSLAGLAKRSIYLLVNGLAFITIYRLPSI